MKYEDDNCPSLDVYPLSNYTFAAKEAQYEEDATVSQRLTRLQHEFAAKGLRRSVEGILLVHEHGHPHILLLQVASSFFKLPGDRVDQLEKDLVRGLQDRLQEKLGRDEDETTDWEIKEVLAQWWRPQFESFMYPYVPVHVTEPKEVKQMFVVQLPQTKVLACPKNQKLLAVPLFELYDNAVRFGPQLAALPNLLSRYSLNIIR